MKKKKVFRIILFLLLLSTPTYFAVQANINLKDSRDKIYSNIKSGMMNFASSLDQYLLRTPSKEIDIEFCYLNFGTLQDVEGNLRAFPIGVKFLETEADLDEILRDLRFLIDTLKFNALYGEPSQTGHSSSECRALLKKMNPYIQYWFGYPEDGENSKWNFLGSPYRRTIPPGAEKNWDEIHEEVNAFGHGYDFAPSNEN